MINSAAMNIGVHVSLSYLVSLVCMQCGPFLKDFIEFVKILLLFYVWVFFFSTCGILCSPPGIELTTFALEGKVLTTGLPGKSQSSILNVYSSL